jgi:hypothetical protein
MFQANELQPSKQPPLLFIEQAIEQKDGSLHFIGRGQKGGGMDGHRNGLSTVRPARENQRAGSRRENKPQIPSEAVVDLPG